MKKRTKNDFKNLFSMPSDKKRFVRQSPEVYLRHAKIISISIFALTFLFNAVSMFFLPATMGVPIEGFGHTDRMSSWIFLGALTVMQGLLCYKGFTAMRCAVVGVLLLILDIALVILNFMYPAGLI